MLCIHNYDNHYDILKINIPLWEGCGGCGGCGGWGCPGCGGRGGGWGADGFSGKKEHYFFM